jgi:hypothetical protein
VIFIVVTAVLAFVVRTWIGRVEVARIVSAAEELGWRSIRVSRSWPPELSGRKGTRWYLVRGRDRDGGELERHCWTALRSGKVHWR